MRKVTAEQALSEWSKFIGFIDTYISSPRKEKLLNFYNDRQERFITMPASAVEYYHGAFPTGYLIHVNRVTQGCLDLMEVWSHHGSGLDCTKEEAVFSCISHDLGKYGTDAQPYYIPNESEWHRKNQGKVYEYNGDVSKMTVPDRSILLLTENGITFNETEFLAIKTHDGLYDEANKYYLLQTYHWKQKPKSSLIYIIHQADIMAARIEFEEWRDNYRDDAHATKSYAKKGLSTRTEKLSPTATQALDELFKS